jgi:acetoin utilization protein AcuC
MGAAARLIDGLAHEWAGGRWLATGGGGYDVYRVVPRAWAQVWLAGAHRAVPQRLPEDWRERWAGEGERYGQAPLPEMFDDPPNAGLRYEPMEQRADERAPAIAERVLELVLPHLRSTEGGTA